MVYYNSLDLDKVTKEELSVIVAKITIRKCCKAIQVKDSFSKGYHILLTCERECDICRLAFDDQKRLEMDSNRDRKFQNTLFDEKEYVSGNLRDLGKNPITDKKRKEILSIECDNCRSVMDLKELTIEEFEKKIWNKIEKSKLWKMNIMYLGYSVFVCPKCKWFKLIKAGELINDNGKIKELSL